MIGTYKKIKDNNKKTGRGNKTWEYIELVDEIYGKDPIYNFKMVAASGVTTLIPQTDKRNVSELPEEILEPHEVEELEANNCQATKTKSNKCAKRKKKNDAPEWFVEFIDEFKKESQIKREMFEKNNEILEEKNFISRELVTLLKDLRHDK